MILKSVFAAMAAVMMLAAIVATWQRMGPIVASAEDDPVPAATPSPNAPAARKAMFFENLPRSLELPSDETGSLLLREYGAVFLTRNGAVAPSKVIYIDDKDVDLFQHSVASSVATIGGTKIQLQKAAMDALTEAIAEAASSGLSIGPRGADSGSRSYEQTRRLWASRVEPAFRYWVAKGRVSKEEADRIQKLSTFDQAPEILKLEKSEIWFAKSLDKSIIYSVAPPGTSQHLSMLAFDVAQFDDPRVRAILSRHGWFQTVVSDLPHFTYLGVDEKELPQLGLKRKEESGRTFWVPDI